MVEKKSPLREKGPSRPAMPTDNVRKKIGLTIARSREQKKKVGGKVGAAKLKTDAKEASGGSRMQKKRSQPTRRGCSMIRRQILDPCPPDGGRRKKKALTVKATGAVRRSLVAQSRKKEGKKKKNICGNGKG